MHTVGAGWLMTSLTNSLALIALVQTAMTLPVFIFSIPSGIWADAADLPKFLCITQGWMAVAALALSFMTAFGIMTPFWLLLLTFILGIGAAVNFPAMQSAVSTMVPNEDLRGAVTLNSISYNIARIVGPAIGGYLIALKGPALVFMLNAVSFIFVIAVFFIWYKQPREAIKQKLNLKNSLSGFKHIFADQHFKAILIRTLLFFFCASIVWSFAPIIAKFQLGKGVQSYANLVMCLGIGAIAGGFCLAKLRAIFSREQLAFFSSISFALMLSIVIFTRTPWIIYVALIMGGANWINMTSTFNTLALEALPKEFKSRAFAVYSIVFNGGIAIGSALWGNLADLSNFRIALITCAVSIFLGAFAARWWQIEK